MRSTARGYADHPATPPLTGKVPVDVSDFFTVANQYDLKLLECQMTYTCNIRCAYCFNPHHKRVDELSLDEWVRVVDEAAALGATSVVINGGEPVTRPDVCLAVFSAARRHGMSTALSTNGILLNRQLLGELAGVLNVLQISIHPWRYLHALGDGIGQFAEHVRTFRELGGERAVFNVVLEKGLVVQLEKVLNTVAEKASGLLDAVGVQAASPYGQGYLNPTSIPSAREVTRASEIIRRNRAETGLPVLDHVKDYFSVKPNMWGSYGVIVNPAGYVYPLIEGADTLSDIAKELSFDNVRDLSLAEIWTNSPALTRYRGTDWLPEPCQGCEVRDKCRGGSRLNAYVLTSDMSRPDPFCVLAPDHDRVLARYGA